MNMQRLARVTRTLVTGLWLPALFLAGVLSSYLLAFHHPAPHQRQFGIEEPMLTGRVADQSGQPLPGAAVIVTDLQGRQLVRTRTDRNGDYAATGFSDANALVFATMPGRQAAAAQLLLSSAEPMNQDFVLGTRLPARPRREPSSAAGSHDAPRGISSELSRRQDG
jgi:hypothetical protein